MSRVTRAQSMRGRFTHIPLHGCECVYVAHFTNGVVKVGYSSQPRLRLSSATGQARRMFGDDVSLRDAYVTQAQCDRFIALKVEEIALSALRASVPPLPDTSDFFAGIAFDEAVQIVQTACSRALAA